MTTHDSKTLFGFLLVSVKTSMSNTGRQMSNTNHKQIILIVLGFLKRVITWSNNPIRKL